MKVLVLVKASPVLTRELDETMCVAGVRLHDETPAWIRLHPVPFRDLDDDRKFAKYQIVDVQAERPRSDRRPESWSPTHASITPEGRLDTNRDWADRRQIIEQLPESTMCGLIEANRQGSGPGVPSLGIVRPVSTPKLLITERDPEQLAKWHERAAGAAARMSLFDDPDVKKPEFEVVPWRFRYEFRCSDCGPGSSHKQTIVDWEVLTLWRRVRYRENWRELMRAKFEETLWAGRDSVLFVGNQEQHPISFLVLGVFWPPAGPFQPSLSL
jgi:hypothetical protein